MFTGIVQDLGVIIGVEKRGTLIHYQVDCPLSMVEGVSLGASVSVDGVCQTVVSQDQGILGFDAIEETLDRTTLSEIHIGRRVNLERSLRFGDEVGGHLLSGHVFSEAWILERTEDEGRCVLRLGVPVELVKYLMPKGFVALDGASLTVGDVDREFGTFTVHLIPETLQRTTLGWKQAGDRVNFELDSQTQTLVDTVERILEAKESV